MTNNKAQHTPGPWEACQDSIGRWYIIAPRASRHDVLISPILPCPTEGFAEANARLIATAPEMLAWLKQCRDVILKYKKDFGHATGTAFDLSVDAVIAKAEGK